MLKKNESVDFSFLINVLIKFLFFALNIQILKYNVICNIFLQLFK